MVTRIWNSALVWPVTSCKNLAVEIDAYHLMTRTFLELLHSLLRHLDVFEHNLESLSKLETTFLLKLLDNLTLSIFEDSS